MHILVIGEESNLNECREKFGGGHQYFHKKDLSSAEKLTVQCDVVFDFLMDRDPAQIGAYRDHSTAPLFVNTAKISLANLNRKINDHSGWFQFGFAGLPTFLNREVLEVSLAQEEHRGKLEEVCRQLNTPFQIVEDRVGLVTPRVICMIINEAYYTVEEGTASREDIDVAMKLGTNYPFGPFEWCQKIGVRHVYELLEAVCEDSRLERYCICPLLKKEYLESEK